MKNKIKFVKLFPNNNKKSKEQAHTLQEKLEKNGFVIDNNKFSLAIAIGGDGSFIRMVKDCNFDDDIYYLGVNTGTLGFAQEIYPDEVDTFLERLKNEDYKIEEIGVEETKVKTKEGVLEFNSLNEILVRDKELNTIKLTIMIDEKRLENFVGDGILVSTSFGSSAYNLSFGGSIVYSDLHTMQITPESRIVSLIPKELSNQLIITVDGENKSYNDVQKIEISVKKKIKFVRMTEYDYTKKIHEKFL